MGDLSDFNDPSTTGRRIQPTGTFYLRETGDARNIYQIFLLMECPIHILNLLFISATPYYLFSYKCLVHKNLKLTIVSNLIAAYLLSISRLAWLIGDLLWLPIDIMEVFMFLRFIFQTSVSAHLFVFSAERVIATIKSKRYEKKSCYFFMIFCCFLTYPYSLILLYSKYNFEKGREINVAMTIICSAVALISMAIVYITNKKRVKQRRWKAEISEAYQMRENIRSSQVLLRVFLISSVFLVFACGFLLRFSACLPYPELIMQTISYGFLYDIIVVVASTFNTIVFCNFLIPNTVQNKWMHILQCPCFRNNRTILPEEKGVTFKSIHGNEVEIGRQSAEADSKYYFSQLSQAWK